METADINATELSKLTGISKSTISRYLSGGYVPKQKRTDLIARALHTDPGYLIAGTQNQQTSVKPIGVRIPILGRVTAGIPIEAITDIDGYEEITPKLAATGSFFALHINGDSMSPYMLPNDIVIVRCQEDVECGDIAVILVNSDEATVKKVQKSKEGLTLIGMNPSVYAPHFYTNQEILELPVNVIGKVVEIRRPLP